MLSICSIFTIVLVFVGVIETDYSKLWVDMANKSSAINVYARVMNASTRMGIDGMSRDTGTPKA